jgi:hypothetical protein
MSALAMILTAAMTVPGDGPLAPAVIIAYALRWRPGVTEMNVWRIRVGMAEKEVEVIFGKTWDEWESGDGGSWMTWYAENGGSAELTFDEEGKVDSASFWYPNGSVRSPLDRIRIWLGW